MKILVNEKRIYVPSVKSLVTCLEPVRSLASASAVSSPVTRLGSVLMAAASLVLLFSLLCLLLYRPLSNRPVLYRPLLVMLFSLLRLFLYRPLSSRPALIRPLYRYLLSRPILSRPLSSRPIPTCPLLFLMFPPTMKGLVLLTPRLLRLLLRHSGFILQLCLMFHLLPCLRLSLILRNSSASC